MEEKVKIVILAAGRGKRMKSDTPKVLLPLRGKSLLEHLHTAAKEATGKPPLVVISPSIIDAFRAKFNDAPYRVQTEQLGTGHAVITSEEALGDAEHVMVLYGDHPLIKSETIKKIIDKHIKSRARVTFSTVLVPNFDNLYKPFWSMSRVLRKNGKIIEIREFKDTTSEEKKIKEVVSGYSVFEAKWLWKKLRNLKNDNAQREYYLTELLKIALEEGEKIEIVSVPPIEGLGANSKEDLEILEKFAV